MSPNEKGDFPITFGFEFQHQAPVSRTQGIDSPLPPVCLTQGSRPQAFSSSWGSRRGQLRSEVPSILWRPRSELILGDTAAAPPGAMAFLSLSLAPCCTPETSCRQTAHPLAWAPLWLLSHGAYWLRTEGKKCVCLGLGSKHGAPPPCWKDVRLSAEQHPRETAAWVPAPVTYPHSHRVTSGCQLPLSGPAWISQRAQPPLNLRSHSRGSV